MRTPRRRINEGPQNFYSDVDPLSPTSQPSLDCKGRQPHTLCPSPIPWSGEPRLDGAHLAIPQLTIILPKVSAWTSPPLDFGHSFSTISSMTNPAHPHLRHHWRPSSRRILRVLLATSPASTSKFLAAMAVSAPARSPLPTWTCISSSQWTCSLARTA